MAETNPKTSDSTAADANAAAAGPTGLAPANDGVGTAAEQAARTTANLAQRRRDQAQGRARAGGAPGDVEDRTKPTGPGSFGHTPQARTPVSPEPAEERTSPENAPASADIMSDRDLMTDEERKAHDARVSGQPAAQPNPLQHPSYDVQKVFRTANQSVVEEGRGRFKIKFPESVDTSGFDKNDINVNPNTTFASRELAYKAAVRLLKTSPSMAWRGRNPAAA